MKRTVVYFHISHNHTYAQLKLKNVAHKRKRRRTEFNAKKVSETASSVTIQGITEGAQTYVCAYAYSGDEIVGYSVVILLRAGQAMIRS